MQFRRNGQAGERRRRVLRDDVLAAADKQEESADGSSLSGEEADGRVYSDAALAQRQSPITSLLPQRPLTLVALFILCGSIIAGIELLYSHLFIHLPEAFQMSLKALDINARGSIAAWYATLTLFVGAITSALIYVIRRHRLDDYRGRYRMWQWATAAFILASFDAATGIHAILRPSMIQLTGTALHGDGSVWTISLVGAAIACCLTRLAIEVRASRLTLFFLFLSAGCYVGFAVAKFHPAITATPFISAIVGSSTLLAGHFCLVYTLAIYGRHVYQEAQGTRRAGSRKPIVKPAKKARGLSRRKKITTTSTPTGAKNVRIDAAHEKSTAVQEPEPTPTISKKSIRKTTSQSNDKSSAADEVMMSKAERRRLRKLERRQKRQNVGGEDS